MTVKKTLIFLFILLGSSTQLYAQDFRTLFYVTLKTKEVFEASAQVLFKENIRSCGECQISPLFVADDKGNLDVKKVTQGLETLPESTKIIVFDFNFTPKSGMDKWKEKLNKIQEKGILIFVESGVPEPGERPSLLSQTFFGSLKDIFLFAELSIGERMWPNSHYGPEIFTSKKMPENYSGQSLVSLDFGSRWLLHSSKRSSTEWIAHLLEKKKNSKRLWVDSRELF